MTARRTEPDAPGQSITVPRGTRHRLSNPAASALKLIEIGYGEALGDDDTVRLDRLTLAGRRRISARASTVAQRPLAGHRAMTGVQRVGVPVDHAPRR